MIKTERTKNCLVIGSQHKSTISCNGRVMHGYCWLFRNAALSSRSTNSLVWWMPSVAPLWTSNRRAKLVEQPAPPRTYTARPLASFVAGPRASWSTPTDPATQPNSPVGICWYVPSLHKLGTQPRSHGDLPCGGCTFPALFISTSGGPHEENLVGIAPAIDWVPRAHRHSHPSAPTASEPSEIRAMIRDVRVIGLVFVRLHLEVEILVASFYICSNWMIISFLYNWVMLNWWSIMMSSTIDDQLKMMVAGTPKPNTKLRMWMGRVGKSHGHWIVPHSYLMANRWQTNGWLMVVWWPIDGWLKANMFRQRPSSLMDGRPMVKNFKVLSTTTMNGCEPLLNKHHEPSMNLSQPLSTASWSLSTIMYS